MVAPDAPDNERIEMVVPLRTRHAATLRVVAASLGADAGLTVDEIDDLRLAISEAFSLLLQDRDGRVRLSFAIEPGRISVRVSAAEGGSSVEPDAIAQGILAAVVDSCTFDDDGITLVKAAAESTASGLGAP